MTTLSRNLFLLVTLLSHSTIPTSAQTVQVNGVSVFGGAGEEFLGDMVADSAGNRYLFGETKSADFPSTRRFGPGGGDDDAYLVKIDPRGAVVFAVRFGGDARELGRRVMIDRAGNVLTTGYTSSANFPRTTGAAVPGNNLAFFIARFSPTGELLAAATLLASKDSGPDPTAIAQDASGAIYIGGWLQEIPFTGTVNRNGPRGSFDSYVCKIDESLSQIAWLSVAGGASEEWVNDIRFDSAGNALVGGITTSADFPLEVGPVAQITPGGGYVQRLNAATGRMEMSRTDVPRVTTMLVSGGNLYFCGRTRPPNSNAVVQAMNLRGETLWRTEIGGAATEGCTGMAAEAATGFWVSGWTDSADFPVTSGALQRTIPTRESGWLGRISTAGEFTYTTFLFGSHNDSWGVARSITVTGNDISVAGQASVARAELGGQSLDINAKGEMDNYLLRLRWETGIGLTAAGIVNAASFAGGAVAAGEIVTVFASGIGPDRLVTAELDAQGLFTNKLAATSVLFDGVPSPMIYAARGQVSAIVPYAVATRTTSQVTVDYGGLRPAAVSVPVVPAAPGIFTLASGRGQAAALNGNECCNSAQRPARPGDVVVLFATGEGQTSPPGVDGRISNFPTLPEYPRPIGAVQLTIGGVEAQITYAGAAPGLVACVLQINAVVPAGVAEGNAAIVLRIGGRESQTGVTLAIGR